MSASTEDTYNRIYLSYGNPIFVLFGSSAESNYNIGRICIYMYTAQYFLLSAGNLHLVAILENVFPAS